MPGLRLLATRPKTWCVLLLIHVQECCASRCFDDRYYARNSSWEDAGAIQDAWAAGGALGSNSLRAGGSMVLGEMLASESKDWLLHLQSDGDLVLSSSGGVKWRSYTAGVGARVDMLWNGNLVVVDHVDSIVFQTGTSAHAAAYLILHNSGELAMYWRGALLWSAS